MNMMTIVECLCYEDCVLCIFILRKLCNCLMFILWMFPTANMVGGAKLGGSPMAQKGTHRYTQLAKTTSSHTKKPQKSSSTKKVTNKGKGFIFVTHCSTCFIIVISLVTSPF